MYKRQDFTSDVRVRRAINLAIDRQAMIDHVLNGHGTIAYSVCDKMPWYSKDSEAAFDPQEAERLLDEAGWKTGADGIREKDGKKAGFTMLYSAGDSVRQALSEDTANQLAAFGIHVTVELSLIHIYQIPRPGSGADGKTGRGTGDSGGNVEKVQ